MKNFKFLSRPVRTLRRRVSSASGCLPARLIPILLFGLSVSCNHPSRPLFTRMSPSETGIDVVNTNNDTDSLNILDYMYYYNGGGVAIGDINDDGRPDICFTSNTNGPRLYLNKGNWSFKDITREAGLTQRMDWSTGVTMADVNGDGRLDIFICAVGDHQPPNGIPGHMYFRHSRNLLYINQGGSSFQEQAHTWGLDDVGYNTQAAFLDYDKDGDLDLFLLQHSVHQNANYGDTSVRSTYSKVSGGKLYRNDGDHFTNVTEGSGIRSSSLGYGLGVSVADIDHDGYDDIYVGNDFHENDYCYINNRKGAFVEMSAKLFGHTSKFSMGNDIGDINHDAWPDIVTLDMLPADEKVLKSSASDDSYESFESRRRSGFQDQNSRNCLQLNVGEGRMFSEVGLFAGIAATDWSWSPLLADFNLDGQEDLFISNGIKRRLNDLDYVKFISSKNVGSTSSPDRSHDPELLAGQPPGAWHDYFFEGGPGLGFRDRSIENGFEAATLSHGAAYGDLDGDGDIDLVTNVMNDVPGLFRNDAKQRTPSPHHLSVDLRFRDPNAFALGAKVFLFASGVATYKEVQPVHGFMSASETVLHFGLGSREVADSMSIIWPDGTWQVIRNIRADQQVRVLWEKGKTDTISDQASLVRKWLQQERPSLFQDITGSTGIDFVHQDAREWNDFYDQPLMPHQTSDRGPRMAVADVDGDGLEDVYICGGRGQHGRLYMQRPGGKFMGSDTAFLAGSGHGKESDAVFFDADQDGSPDLFIVHGGNGADNDPSGEQDLLYLNDGHGHFRPSPNLPAFKGDRSVVAAGDYDGDGKIDVFIGCLTVPHDYGAIPESHLLHNDGQGRFSPAPVSVAPGLDHVGMVTDAQWSDLNGDGRMDLVVAGEWMPVSIFINEKTALRKLPAMGPFRSGWWRRVAIGDINGDRKADMIAGNYGLNSKLKASEQEPLKLYVGDLDGNGKRDPLLVTYRQGEQYPFLGKEDLESKLPYLKKRFLTYARMAGKTASEIFGDALQTSRHLSAASLASTAGLNNGKAVFRPMDVPAMMQWSPVSAFLMDDFDHDGREDVLAGGNFFGVIPYEGRYDAMPLVLARGNGKGAWQNELPVEKDLRIRGEISDLKKIRIAGRNAVLVARNDQAVLVLAY